MCASDEWRDMVQQTIMPWALGSVELGGDVLEVGPGPGMTTDALRAAVTHLTAVELDDDLAARLAARLSGSNVDVVQADATAMPFEDDRFTGAVSFTMLHHVPSAELQDRLFAEVARVLRPGAVFVASDSVASDDLAAFHTDDVYNPIDPTTLEARLAAAGFDAVEVEANPFGWRARAVAA
jgi:SAM-dependent methyltransferase